MRRGKESARCGWRAAARGQEGESRHPATVDRGEQPQQSEWPRVAALGKPSMSRPGEHPLSYGLAPDQLRTAGPSATTVSNSVCRVAVITGSLGNFSEGAYQGLLSTTPPRTACATIRPISSPSRAASLLSESNL